MAGSTPVASALKHLHVRLAAPSAVWTTDRSSSACVKPLDSRDLPSASTALRSSSGFGLNVNSCTRQRSPHVGSTVRQQFQPAARSTVDSSACCPSVMTKPTTLYDVLGISDMVTDDEIKAAFRRVAKQMHPDQAPPGQIKEYQEKFMEAHRAYSILKDPRTRSLYNYEIKNSAYRQQFNFDDQKRPMWRGRNWETDQCWTS